MREKCKCISYNQPEDWQTDKELILQPPFQEKSVCVDYCIAGIILFLWEKGIHTLGSCCGHNEKNPSINDTIRQYRLDRMKGQDSYIELWVEKDALSGVLRRITEEFHINLMVNRGYSSCTAMHDAFERIERAEDENKEATILYLGDHDPSGLDMIRDIEERLNEFGVDPEVVAIGLTMAQIKKYKPPPNPAKVSDPRAKNYIQEFGSTSWEVDALNPKILHALVRKNVEKRIDIDLFNKQIKQEEIDKVKLQKIARDF